MFSLRKKLRKENFLSSINLSIQNTDTDVDHDNMEG